MAPGHHDRRCPVRQQQPLSHIVLSDRGKRSVPPLVLPSTTFFFRVHRIFDAKPVPIRTDLARGREKLLLFHHALQGVLVLAREVHHLRYLGLGDFIGENAALADPMMMNVQHDLGRGLDILLEEFL